MHVARGGWLGQTFALAKFDDSFEGKKSGIRRSKDERKGMIETFIKRYQKLNNGDFPSLNLTRKEVGGSFYTVREIVREIIQENRVLGPPKSPPGDQNMANLNSFLEHYPPASIAEDHTGPPNDTQTPSEYAFISESATELHQGNNDIVANHTNKYQTLKNVDITSEGDIAHSLPESKLTLASQKGKNHSTSKENLVLDVNGSTEVKLEDTLFAEEKTVNDANYQNSDSKTSCSSVQQPAFRSANLNNASDQPGADSQRITNATLNRINLESWKAASKKSNGRETHQLVKFIKSFITAFVKFWSE